MRPLIIRDDDLSFWTSPEEVNSVYQPLFDKRIKVSFATIPFAVKTVTPGNRSIFYQEEDSSTPLDKNKEIVTYIREKIAEGLVEIMLHGYNHLYLFKCGKTILTATQEHLAPYQAACRSIFFLGEYNYQSYEKLNRKTREGKTYLEDIFKVKIKNFVPPSNQINKAGIQTIVKNKLNLSGLVGKKYNREITLRGLITYLDRILFAWSRKGITYPKIADYGQHRELAGYALTPSTDWEKYKK